MKLIRGYTDRGTFGNLFDNDGDFICYTLETTWHNNAPNISCVPEGDYRLIEIYSNTFGRTYALKNHELGVGVSPGDALRNMILFHPANFRCELKGCIAPGEDQGVLQNQISGTESRTEWAITSSRQAFRRLMTECETDHELTITHYDAKWYG